MIIPFFIMNRGCRHRCRFCNQGLTAGNHPEEIASAAFTARVRSFLASRGEKPGSVQIAFYGGTFTALPEAEQERLLALAEPFLKGGEVRGIRLSTRPDSLDARRISRLRDLGVTTIEVGAQSMDDRVLAKSDRGHGSEEVRQAVTALREAGIETGLHLMAGLPGDSPELFSATIGKAIDLRPDTVRIHPTLVLRDTPLAEDFLLGHYRPLTLDEAIGWCRQALQQLSVARIPIIRLGLQSTADLETPGAILAGPFHPAFRSLVEESLFQQMAFSLLSLEEAGKAFSQNGSPLFSVAPADISLFLGPGRAHLAALEKNFSIPPIRITTDPSLCRGTLILQAGSRQWRTDFSGHEPPQPGASPQTGA